MKDKITASQLNMVLECMDEVLPKLVDFKVTTQTVTRYFSRYYAFKGFPVAVTYDIKLNEFSIEIPFSNGNCIEFGIPKEKTASLQPLGSTIVY